MSQASSWWLYHRPRTDYPSKEGDSVDRLMTPKETAERLRCSLPQVYAYSSRGVLPKIKLGGKLLFQEADVDAYVQTCRIEARQSSEL